MESCNNCKKEFVYPFILEEQEEGGYLIRFPDFPEAITQCETKSEALQIANDCLEEAIANRIVMGIDIPVGKDENNED